MNAIETLARRLHPGTWWDEDTREGAGNLRQKYLDEARGHLVAVGMRLSLDDYTPGEWDAASAAIRSNR